MAIKKSPLSPDSLSMYFKEVESTSMLTAAAERELIAQYKENGDRRAQSLIIKGALRYVIAEARKNPKALRDQTVMEDLIAAGNIGLLRALDKFKLEAGTRFLTYASWWVKHEMREESRRLGIVHVPAHASSKGTRPPAITELIENVLYVPESTDHSLRVQTQQSILKLLGVSTLSVREIFIIKTCYGIHSPPKTLKQIGSILEITGERVRQLRETALSKMKTISESDRSVLSC